MSKYTLRVVDDSQTVVLIRIDRDHAAHPNYASIADAVAWLLPHLTARTQILIVRNDGPEGYDEQGDDA